MNVWLDNVEVHSTSGPNTFGRRLMHGLIRHGHHVYDALALGDASAFSDTVDVSLTFIQRCNSLNRLAVPDVLRLDGIYFNTAQDYVSYNAPIKHAYDNAAAVIVQSMFDYTLVTNFFGCHDNISIIHNCTDVNVNDIEQSQYVMTPRELTWCCASSWRPHKRLMQNIEYFITHAPDHAVMYIAGYVNDDDAKSISQACARHNKQVLILGSLPQHKLHALMRLSCMFVHLAYLDHCPNVVIDARALGCQIVCASSGGTHEIAGDDAIVVCDDEWDFSPCKLYEPPTLDLKNIISNKDHATHSVQFDDVIASYELVMHSVC